MTAGAPDERAQVGVRVRRRARTLAATEAMLDPSGRGLQHEVRILWGINLYPAEPDDSWIEFDSMINVRPSQGNRSRGVDDADARAAIRRVVASLVRF